MTPGAAQPAAADASVFRVRCPACSEADLDFTNSPAVCPSCGKAYPNRSGRLVFEEPGQTDLRIASQVFDLHRLRKQRRYYDRYVDSDVEYTGRMHSCVFMDTHATFLEQAGGLYEATVVDLGCGQIPYSEALQEKGLARYVGIDLSDVDLSIAEANAPAAEQQLLLQTGIYRVPLPDDYADGVISSEVIEHLDAPLRYLEEAYRICKPGGRLSISTPCASMYTVPSNLVRLLVRPRRVREWWKRMNAHRHWEEALTWHPGLRPSVLRKWIERAGFQVERHETRLWYFGTRPRIVWRLFRALERLGVRSSGRWFEAYLRLTDRLLASRIPGLRWMGIRQFVVARKPTLSET